MSVYNLPPAVLLAAAASICFVSLYLVPRVLGKRKYHLPPGPPGEFVLGHYRKIPFVAAFKQYAKWSREYSMFCIQRACEIIASHSNQATLWQTLTSCILKHSGQNGSCWTAYRRRWTCWTSGEPTTATGQGLSCLRSESPTVTAAGLPAVTDRHRMGWAPTLTWLRWGPRMQRHRRILQPAFSKSQVRQYQDNQKKQALLCLKSIADDPNSWNNAIRRFAVAIVLNISFGVDVDGPDSPWIKIADDAAEAISNSGAPASSIVDRFPASKCGYLIYEIEIPGY